MFKVRQQKLALSVALYVLRENGFPAPKKKHVLNFIRMKRLLQFPEQELNRRRDTDIDEIWANDICWRRKDLFMDGRVDSPERGHWRLTETGLRKIEERKPLWIKFEEPAKRQDFLEKLDYCTPELIDWIIRIAKGDSLHLTKQ